MHLYDRNTKALTDIEDGLPNYGSSQGEVLRYGVVTPTGLAIGAPLAAYGAIGLVDPVSLEWTVVLPSYAAETQAHETRWSPDFRYASYAIGGGHGGLC
jgi:hypothetical protein